jgi:peptidoglycan/LPS O-acetylase OafA/YrhL
MQKFNNFNIYNHQIDILRAIAVFLVILHHLNINFFKGGFIGVDVFLVISGYLITKNIIQEQANTNKLSVKKFYEKRILRLAPAFFTVIWTAFLVFGLALTDQEWEQFLKTVIASITLSSNIFFSVELNDYFSINAYSTPLLHIWSLSLEEQFYLIWPFILILIFNSNHKNYKLWFLLLIILSLSSSEYLARNEPIFAYYLLPSRIFEFVVGAMVAIIPYKKNVNHRLCVFFTLISIIVIVVSSLLINNQTKFPTYIALIPCIFSGFFIYFSQYLRKYTSLQPIYYLGKISYPLYLWHWPIIIYISIYSIHLSTITNCLIILFTIALSIITHELIEKQIKSNSEHKNVIRNYFLFPLTITLAVSLIFLNKDKIVSNQKDLNTKTHSITCIDSANHPLEPCYFGSSKPNKIDVIVVGDSHANAFAKFVNVLAKDANLKGYEITYSSTFFLLNTKRYTRDHLSNKFVEQDNFSRANKNTQIFIQKIKPKYVILGGYFPHSWHRDIYSNHTSGLASQEESVHHFINGLISSIEFIESTQAIPILINDNPLLITLNENCNLRTNTPKDKCYENKDLLIKEQKEWNLILDNLKKQFPKLIVVDFNNIICDNTKCYSFIDNIPLYRDNQHLSYEGATKIGVEYLKSYKNPLKSNDINLEILKEY